MDSLIPRSRLEPAGEAFPREGTQPCLISKPHERGGFQRGAGLGGGRLDPIRLESFPRKRLDASLLLPYGSDGEAGVKETLVPSDDLGTPFISGR